MSGPIIETAQAELLAIQKQKAELAAKEGALKNLIAAYSGSQPNGLMQPIVPTPASAPAVVLPAVDPAVGAPQRGTTGRVIEIAKAVLAQNGALHTRDLMPVLESQGISVGGKDPAAAVSAILSREKDIFRNDRKAGWMLKPQDDSELDDLLR
jgi:hypothetical protein